MAGNQYFVRQSLYSYFNMEDDLVAAYSGLGTADGDQYYRGEECIGL